MTDGLSVKGPDIGATLRKVAAEVPQTMRKAMTGPVAALALRAVAHAAPRRSGRLARSFSAVPTDRGVDIVSDVPYALVVDEGRRPVIRQRPKQPRKRRSALHRYVRKARRLARRALGKLGGGIAKPRPHKTPVPQPYLAVAERTILEPATEALALASAAAIEQANSGAAQ